MPVSQMDISITSQVVTKIRWHDPLHSSERNGAGFHQSGRLHRDR